MWVKWTKFGTEANSYLIYIYIYIYMVKWSRCRPGVAQRVGRGIALLFHDRGTRRGWVVSSTPRPHFTPGKDPVPILQEAGWAPGPVWTGRKSRPHRYSIPDRPSRSQSLYRLSYSAHIIWEELTTKRSINSIKYRVCWSSTLVLVQRKAMSSSPRKGTSEASYENNIMKRWMICTPHPVQFGW